MDPRHLLLRRIRILLAVFILGLLVCGITAFPLEWELRTLTRLTGVPDAASAANYSGITAWLITVRDGLADTYARYPWLAYGTDWLAFAHIVLAILFIGPWRDPVRNLWVIEFGLIACVLVIPLAMICGPLRGIPLYWRLIDCSFGVVGLAVLWPARTLAQKLMALHGERPCG